uniref:Uncharacterized protein n=1 Tax=Oryza nivara TaxID=4536 RepID=A0A0E0J8L9_ORYNI
MIGCSGGAEKKVQHAPKVFDEMHFRKKAETDGSPNGNRIRVDDAAKVRSSQDSGSMLRSGMIAYVIRFQKREC